jgi:hypothetical protein
MTNTTIESRRTALLDRTSLKTLVQSAMVMETIKNKTPEQRMTAAWIYDEIERRVGLITDAEGPEFERVYDETDSYMAALVALRPQLAK